MSYRDEIAVFADLDNPKIIELTESDVQNNLEGLIKDDYKTFSSRHIGMIFLASITGVSEGDSTYGTRMKLVKMALASAMYSPDTFLEYLNQTVEDHKKEAERLEAKFSSRWYRIKKGWKSIPERARRRVGRKPRPFYNRYFNDVEEQRMVTHQNRLSDAYSDFVVTVKDMDKEFGKKDIGEIIRLAELDHIFSGKYNETGLNLTFTNERVRHYSERLQQVVRSIHYAILGEDIAPLTEQQLYPVTFEDGII